jgi:nitrogen fixation NifU-like protein
VTIIVTPQSEYSDVVVDHFEQPRNVGRFAPASDVIEGSAGHRDQGVRFTLSARVAESVIRSVRFEVYGCPHCIAAGSWLSQRLVGCTRDDLQRWSWREVDEVIDMPPAKRGRLLILEDAVRALAEAWDKVS